MSLNDPMYSKPARLNIPSKTQTLKNLRQLKKDLKRGTGIPDVDAVLSEAVNLLLKGK